MVPDGEFMDAAIQERGIREGSTIVFMGNNSERIYFFFRYWGFPKEQLKVLNGGTSAWEAAGYDLTTVVPRVAESSFSVKDLPNGPDADCRAALSEMIQMVANDSVVPFATFARTSDVTKALITDTVSEEDDGRSGYVIFQGRMAGLIQDESLFQSYLNGGSYNISTGLYNADGTYKSKADMVAYLNSLGIDGSKPIATYCRAGNLAANGFTPMDVVLDDWDIMLYDGSWSQWGSLTNYTDVPSADYALPTGYEEWATDVLTPTISYNADLGADIYKPDFFEAPKSPYDAEANTLEDEDYEYWSTPAESGGASGPVSGGGGGGC
jgi:3-mercaptopyruvate sulfurtransferase SseA